MKIKKESIYLLIIFFIIFFNEKCFYLLDLNSSLWIYLLVIISIILIILNINLIFKNRYRFILFIFTFLVLNFIEICMTTLKFGQPFSMALGRYKYLFIFIAYIPISVILKKIKIEKLKIMIINLGTLLSILYIIQAMIYPKLIIFNMYYMERADRIRFYTGSYFIIISILLNFSFLLHNFKKKYFVYLIIQIFMLIFVSQTRSSIAILFITFIGTLLIYIRNFNWKKVSKILMIVVLIIIIIMPYISSLVSSINDSLFNKYSDNGSISIRIDAQKYMIDKIKENPLLGVGMYDNAYQEAGSITGSAYKYYVADVGIVGFVFQYGILGLLIFMYLWIKMIILTYKIYKRKKENSLYYIMFLLYNTIILPFNCILNIDNCIIYLIITLCMMEKDLK